LYCLRAFKSLPLFTSDKQSSPDKPVVPCSSNQVSTLHLLLLLLPLLLLLLAG
jgi:hypothetical protein